MLILFLSDNQPIGAYVNHSWFLSSYIFKQQNIMSSIHKLQYIIDKMTQSISKDRLSHASINLSSMVYYASKIAIEADETYILKFNRDAVEIGINVWEEL